MKSFECELRTKLSEKNISSSDIEFIMAQIKCGELDDNLKIMDNEVYNRLNEKGLENIFREACQELGFVFYHSNELES